MATRDILLLTIKADPSNPSQPVQALTAIFFRQIDEQGNIKSIAGPPPVDINQWWAIAAPQPIYDRIAQRVKIATAFLRKRPNPEGKPTDYNDCLYCTFDKNAQITDTGLIGITNQPGSWTSAVIIKQQPFFAWYTQHDWKAVGNHVGIACQAPQPNPSQTWSSTHDAMVETNWGPTLVEVNDTRVYLGCLKVLANTDPAPADTLELMSGNVADITTACFAGNDNQPYFWNAFKYTATGHVFTGPPVLVVSGTARPRLHVLLQTGDKDPHPNNVWYFWVDIDPVTHWPKTKSGSYADLDAQGAGYVDTRGKECAQKPAGLLLTTTSLKTFLYLIIADGRGDLHIYAKPTSADEPNQAWFVPSVPWSTPINVGTIKWPLGGLGACTVPPDWLVD